MNDIDPMRQDQVEREIHRLSLELTHQTEEHALAGEEAARADVAYDLARARALLATPKIVHGEKLTEEVRKAMALDAVADEYTNARMTAAVFEATRERGRNLRAQLDALRSINANVRDVIYHSSGRGA